MFRKVSVRPGNFGGSVRVYGGVIRLPGRNMRFFCYLVDGLLIDAGPVHARKELMNLLSRTPPESVTVTHHHEDHTGNAAYFAKTWDIPLYFPERTRELLQTLDMPLYRRLVWGDIRDPVPTAEIPGDRLATPRGGTLRVIATPGHADDHVCYLDEERGWLFAGDLFVSDRMITGFRFESVPAIIRSLDVVLNFPFDTVFCGHAGVVKDGKAALKRKREWLAGFSADVHELARQGLGIREITRRLLPTDRWISFLSGGEMSPVHLVQSVLADQWEQDGLRK
ncbi:MBL fold metallo-hydrolase [Staphylospora marina]|uniref:MBL fold metallo-hydrolase n=1 Tax=Staphylospora marina TaxID=2490858 RepID=UPI0013DDB707|nr:MBL fold metallo-hydrolase [Staphylospora marina]